MTKLPKATKIQVSRAALMARLNRRLAQQGLHLYASRRPKEGVSRSWPQTGDFYTVNVESDFLVEGHVNPAELARVLGVLKPWEVAPDFEQKPVREKRGRR